MPRGLQSRSRHVLTWVAVSLLAGLMALPFPAVTGAAAKNELVGEWSTSIFGQMVPSSLGNGAALIGRWKISFNDDLSYTLAREDIGAVVSGTYKIDGNHVTITDSGGTQSCAEPQAGTVNAESAATGVYAWKRSGDTLTLKRSSDRCGLRSLLLTAEPLVPYVACTTAPYPLGNTVQIIKQTPAPTLPPATATPAASPGASPVASPVASPGASPVAATVRPNATSQAETGISGGNQPLGKALNTTDAVDTTLAQLTACWATGDPARVLPLFSETFLKDLVSLGPPGTTIDDVGRVFQELMNTPARWKRVTKVTTNGPLKASTVVAMTVDGKATYFKMNFVLEQGQWKLADLGTETTKPKS